MDIGRILACGATDVGRSREDNQDCFLLGSSVSRSPWAMLGTSTQDLVYRRHGFLAAVADGMGGYSGGDRASWIALETLARGFHDAPDRAQQGPEDSIQEIEILLGRVHEALLEAARTDEHLIKSGTTIVGVAMYPMGHFAIFHAGDSRALRFSAGLIDGLTADHSVAGEMIASGQATPDNVGGIPEAWALTSALGPVARLKPAVTTRYDFEVGDRILLCSDGLHSYRGGLSREDLKRRLAAGAPIAELSPELVSAAVEADGQDNTTAVLLDFLSGGAEANEPTAREGKVSHGQ